MFDFGTWRQMIRLSWGEEDPQIRRRFLFKLLVVVPLVASFHALCFALDNLLFPGLARQEVHTPVFMVGHARSGTTLLHRLLSADGDRFHSILLYECYLPSLLQKKLVRLAARVDDGMLGGFLDRRVKAWEDERYGPMRAVHYMSLTMPEEDDIVLYWSCASGFWITELPYMGELDFYYVDRWPEKKRRRYMRFYRDCIRRQLHLDGGDKIYVSKSPVFAGRVRSLIETFPDARFVVNMRNPSETIPSMLNLVRMGYKRFDWSDERMKHSLGVLADQSFDTYLYPLQVLDEHPDTPRAIVDYRELVEKPSETVAAAYQQLGFPMTPEFRKLLEEEDQKARKHQSGHAYSLEQFGLDADVIRERLAVLFDRYHWAEEPGSA